MKLRSKIMMTASVMVLGLAMLAGAPKEAAAAAKMTLNKTSISTTVGKRKNIDATYKNKNVDTKSTWVSSDPSVVSVNKAGVVKALKRGEADITVTLKKNAKVTATCHVSVYGWKTVKASKGVYTFKSNKAKKYKVTVNKKTYSGKVKTLASQIERLYYVFAMQSDTSFTYKTKGGKVQLVMKGKNKTGLLNTGKEKKTFTFTTKKAKKSWKVVLTGKSGAKLSMISQKNGHRLYLGKKPTSSKLIARVTNAKNTMSLQCGNVPATIKLSKVKVYTCEP